MFCAVQTYGSTGRIVCGNLRPQHRLRFSSAGLASLVDHHARCAFEDWSTARDTARPIARGRPCL